MPRACSERDRFPEKRKDSRTMEPRNQTVPLKQIRPPTNTSIEDVATRAPDNGVVCVGAPNDRVASIRAPDDRVAHIGAPDNGVVCVGAPNNRVPCVRAPNDCVIRAGAPDDRRAAKDELRSSTRFPFSERPNSQPIPGLDKREDAW